jgi:hypothetical protein
MSVLGKKRISAVLGLTALTAALGTAGPANAARAATEGSTTPAAVCGLGLGSISSGGDQNRQEIMATTPPTTTQRWNTKNVYGGPQRAASHFAYDFDVGGAGGTASGWVIAGDSMFRSQYDIDQDGQLNGQPYYRRLGGGWSNYVAFEQSNYGDKSFYRTYEYGLRSDGVLSRWTVDDKGGWHSAGTFAGFSSVKSLALISKTRTYDTFLANTRGGALYTIHIPTSSPLKPVVKVVRSSTWQGFDALIAQACGKGVLVVAIDKDTKAAYLYAVGHANGTATVIQNRGKLAGDFDQPTYFRWSVFDADLDPFGGE